MRQKTNGKTNGKTDSGPSLAAINLLESMNGFQNPHTTRLFPPVIDRVQPGKQGRATITHFTLTDADVSFQQVRALAGGDPEVAIPGHYVRLEIDEGDGPKIFMTDTPMEHRSNKKLLEKAHGHVLIAGQGLGMVLPPLLANPRVKSLTILEKYQEVIDLIEPTAKGLPGVGKLTVLLADVFTWEPDNGTGVKPQKFDVIYYDIWPTRSPENLKEMEFLHTERAPLYVNANNRKAWVESWYRPEIRAKQAYEAAGLFMPHEELVADFLTQCKNNRELLEKAIASGVFAGTPVEDTAMRLAVNRGVNALESRGGRL